MREGVTTSFYSPRHIKLRLERAAESDGRSISNYLSRLLDRHLPRDFCPQCDTPTTPHPDATMTGVRWCEVCEEAVGYAAPIGGGSGGKGNGQE